MANELTEIVTTLESDLAEEQKRNKMFLMVGGGLAAFVALYLIWLTVQVNRFLDPPELALAAAGAAVDAAPEVGQQLRATLVDGAPDLARAGSDAAIGAIPAYRITLEEELQPVIDEVTTILAQTAVDRMLASADSPVATEMALQGGADAVVARLDALLDDAMDQKTENDGPTPRETIDETLEQLKVVDRALKQMAAGRGDKQERELVLTWLSVLTSYSETREAAEVEAYKEEAAGKGPGTGGGKVTSKGGDGAKAKGKAAPKGKAKAKAQPAPK